jgi:hypothetical protein
MAIRKIWSLAAVACCGILNVSCQGRGAVVDAYEAGDGDRKTYSVTVDQAWEISKRVLLWEKAGSIEEYREKNHLMASFGMSAVSWGSRAGVWIEKTGEESAVTVVCKRKMALGIATRMTESTFHRWFDRGVKILKSGKSLPESRPSDSDEPQ